MRNLDSYKEQEVVPVKPSNSEHLSFNAGKISAMKKGQPPGQGFFRLVDFISQGGIGKLFLFPVSLPIDL